MSFYPSILIAALAVVGGFGVLWDRHHRGNEKQGNEKQPKGIGVRVIQLFAVFMLVPAIVILASTNNLDTQAAGTLLATIVGYVLSGIGKDE